MVRSFFSGFFGNSSKESAEPVAVNPHNEEFARAAVDEALLALGYLKSNAAQTILGLLPRCGREHPRAVATDFRKSGEQISADEKRNLAIRSNGYMSRQAHSELSEKGLQHPLIAHEITLLRAHFTVNRHIALAQFEKSGIESVQMSGSFPNGCEVCAETYGKIIPTSQANPFPPFRCEKEGCAMMFQARHDFLSGVS